MAGGGALSEPHGLQGPAGDGLIVVFAFKCSWEGLCLLPTDIPGAGVPAGPTVLLSLHHYSGLRRNFGRNKVCLIQSW